MGRLGRAACVLKIKAPTLHRHVTLHGLSSADTCTLVDV